MPIGHWRQWHEQWLFLLYKSYTSDTHGVKAFQSYTAKQRYTVYSYYTAIHRYTLHTLYNTPLAVRA